MISTVTWNLIVLIIIKPKTIIGSAAEIKCKELEKESTRLSQIPESVILPNYSTQDPTTKPPNFNPTEENALESFTRKITELEEKVSKVSDERFCQLIQELQETYENAKNITLDEKTKKVLSDFTKFRNNLRKYEFSFDNCNTSAVSSLEILNEKEIVEYIEYKFTNDDILTILEFLEKLPWIKPSLIGYNLLYNKTKSRKSLNQLITLEISYQVKKLSNSEHFTTEEPYKNLLINLKNSTNNIINNWAAKIRDRSNFKIDNYDIFEKSFQNFLPDLLNKAYDVSWDGKEHYMFKLFIFLKSNEDKKCLQAPAYNVIFDIFRNRGIFYNFVDLFVFSYRMNRTLENSQNCNIESVRILKENYKKTNEYIDYELKKLEINTLPWSFEIYELADFPRTFKFFAETLVRHTYKCRLELVTDMFGITILSTNSQKVIFPVFYKEMKRCNQSNTFPVILLAKSIEFEADDEYGETNQFFHKLLKEMDGDLQYAINQAAINLKKGNYSSFIAYANNYESFYIEALQSIIPIAFENNITIIRNILELGNQSTFEFVNYLTYFVLFDEFEKNNVSGCAELLLETYMKNAYSNVITYDKINRLRSDVRKVNKIFDNANETLHLWKSKIIDNDYSDIVECFANQSLTNSEKSLIGLVYKENRNLTENILKLSRKFSNFSKQLNILSYLYNELKENRELKSFQSVKLLLSIKSVFDECDKFNCSKSELMKSQDSDFSSFVQQNLLMSSSKFIEVFKNCFKNDVSTEDSCISANIDKWS